MKVKAVRGPSLRRHLGITLANRAEYVPRILAERAWHPRLLNGSDYPLPGIMPITSVKDLVSLGVLDEKLVRRCAAARIQFAPLRLRPQAQPEARGEASPPSVFETRAFFEKA
jgi:mannonate dehydratase